MKRYIMIGIILWITLIFLSGCSGPQDDFDPSDIGIPDQPSITQPATEQEAASWLDKSLKEVKTDEMFTISYFKGKPVLLESFAVWCPACKKQQDEIRKLHEEVGDSVISISLDTDPNEDEAKVVEHVDRHGYDWRYAVSSTDFTQQLIDEFGVSVVNAPTAPIILICEDQSSRLLDRGVKTAEELKAEIEKGC